MHRTLRAVLLLPSLLVLGACTDSTSPVSEEEDLISADVAAMVAASTGDDIAVMTVESGDVIGLGALAGCQRNGFMRFVCLRRAFQGSGSLSIERSVTFYDAQGVEQNAFDPETTASINMFSRIEGEREHGQMTSSVLSERDFTVSGLEGPETERTWNGDGAAEHNRTRIRDDVLREYDMSATVTVDDVVIAVPHEGTWPLSGTITRHVRVEVINGLGDTRVRERTVIITFNGTQFPTMTVDGDEFDFDLAARQARRRGRG